MLLRDSALPSHCHACGYDMRGAASMRCPECNTDRRQSSTALLERAAVWSVMDLPRWGSRATAMLRILAWPPAALRPGEPLTRWRHPVRRVLVWAVAGYLLVELFATMPLIGRIIGSWEHLGWLGWRDRVVTVPQVVAFQCLIWLTLAGTIGGICCWACDLRSWKVWTQLSVLLMIALPFGHAAECLVSLLAVALPPELYMKYDLWHVFRFVGYAVFGWYACVVASRMLGHKGRSNWLRLAVVAVLGLTWWFEFELWVLFFLTMMRLRGYPAPELY